MSKVIRKGKRTDQDEAERIAHELHGHLQSACQDMAGDIADHPEFYGDEYAKRIRKAKRAGVTDIAGWLADEFYNDADEVEGLLGDRMCDEVGYGPSPLRSAVMDVLGKWLPAKAAKALRRD